MLGTSIEFTLPMSFDMGFALRIVLLSMRFVLAKVEFAHVACCMLSIQVCHGRPMVKPAGKPLLVCVAQGLECLRP